MSGASIGIMDPAYFVGRKEILAWINDTFSLSLSKIEETCSGAVACQVMDAIYPGEVPMNKVKWDARSDFEYIHNYKILQRVFDKKDIAKHIEVDKLVRGKYQDNLEFMQWTKSFFDKNFAGGDYDATARRKGGKGALSAAGNRGSRGAGRGASEGAAKAAAAPAAASRGGRAAPRATRGGRPAAAASSSSKRVEALDAQVADLKLSVEGLEKERDFYFGKLRDIEILLQGYSGSDPELSKQIFAILYATEADFVVQDDEAAELLADKENDVAVVAE